MLNFEVMLPLVSFHNLLVMWVTKCWHNFTADIFIFVQILKEWERNKAETQGGKRTKEWMNVRNVVLDEDTKEGTPRWITKGL